MSATEAPPDALRQRKWQDRTEVLLTCAGGTVIGDAFMWTGMLAKGPDSPPSTAAVLIGLSIMLVAIALSGVAVLHKSNAVKPLDPINSVPGGSRRDWLTLSILILIHGSMIISIFRLGGQLNIDVVTFPRDASKMLLQGINPYGTTQANIYPPEYATFFYGPGVVVNGRVQVGFQYPPLTLLWALPGYLMGDVRYSYLLAVIISAWILFATCPNSRGLSIVLVLLFNPLTLFVEYLGWSEPLVLMTLTIVIYAAVKKRRWVPIALGLFLATKQYNVLALPLIGLLICPFRWKAYWKLAGWSLAVCAATVIPFAVWNIRGLWHDLVLFHFAQPFRHDGLSFAVPFPWMMKVGPVLVLAFIAWAIRTGKHNASVFAASYGIAMLLFFSTSQQAMTNYYFLIGQSFLLAVAALQSESMSHPISHTTRNEESKYREELPHFPAPSG